MVVLKFLYFSLFAFNCYQCSKLPTEIANKFGPYKAELTNLRVCSGPKRKDLTKSVVELVKIDDFYMMHMNFTFLEEVHIDHVRVEVYTAKNKVKRVLWSHKVDDPCKHFAVGDLFSKYFGISNNCVMVKGDKYFESNMTDMIYAFFGHSFYYGEYIMRADTLSDKGNVLCLHLTSIYKKA